MCEGVGAGVAHAVCGYAHAQVQAWLLVVPAHPSTQIPECTPDFWLVHANCVQEPAFGTFDFTSGKPGTQQNQCRAHMFVMHVAEELDVWPEGSERQRIWVSVLVETKRKGRLKGIIERD